MKLSSGKLKLQYEFSHVQDCVVLMKESIDNGDKLVAYIVSDQRQNDFPAEELKNHKRRLPDHMKVCLLVIFLEKFPLNHSGKVDRQSIISIIDSLSVVIKKEYCAPTTV